MVLLLFSDLSPSISTTTKMYVLRDNMYTVQKGFLNFIVRFEPIGLGVDLPEWQIKNCIQNPNGILDRFLLRLTVLRVHCSSSASALAFKQPVNGLYRNIANHKIWSTKALNFTPRNTNIPSPSISLRGCLKCVSISAVCSWDDDGYFHLTFSILITTIHRSDGACCTLKMRTSIRTGEG